MALVAAVRVDAAVVTSANDVVTTLRTSQAANHEVLFTTSSGVSEGESVEITFDSGFNLSSLTENDIDIADDATELTTAATCAGSENVSVSISSQIITMTVCAGDGGAIAAASAVRVRIGTNATNSGTGSNRITNPSTARNHFVSIGGSFGDVGSIILPLQSGAGVPVGATITGASGGSTEVPACTVNCNVENQADSTPPVLSSVVVSGVTKTEATMSWTTDENANSKVYYGLTNAFELGFVMDTNLVKIHTLQLSNLQEGKMYYFEVRSADQSNNISISSTLTFNTVDQTAPVLSGLVITNITKSSATVSWTTNEVSTGVLDYGTTVAYGTNKMNATMTTDHSFILTGLLSGTVYHFQVKSQDASTNLASSIDTTFATLADLPPTNVAALNLVAGDKSIVLTWGNPDEDDLSGIRVLRCLTDFPTGPADTACTIVLNNSLVETLEQTGLTNGVTYYYGVFAKDTASQFASGALVSGKPSAPEIEVPKDVCGDNICSATETVSSCSADCTVPVIPTGPVCGDSECAATESTSSCPADCAVQTPKGSTCGNGVCDESESSFVCPSDCKVAIEEKSTPGSGVGTLKFSDVTITAAAGSLLLRSTNEYIEVLPRTALSVRVPATTLGAGVDRVTLAIGSESYILRPVTKLSSLSRTSAMIGVAASSSDASVLYYEADVFAPSTTSLNPVTIFVEYVNGQSVTVSSFLRVVAPGVTKGIIDGEETLIAGASVTVYQVSGSESAVWDGSPFGEQNPTTSTSDGLIAWYVPNGRYFVHVEHEKYFSVDTAVYDVKNNILSPSVLMTPLAIKEELPLKTATEAVLSNAVVQESVKQITNTFQRVAESKTVRAVTKSVEEVSKTIETVRANPVVQQAADVSVPTLVVSAGTSVIVMSVAFDFLPFVQYLFTAPILFFGRRKRKAFGVIYNAVSKEAVGLAVVRLYQVKDEQDKPGKLVRSRVTDKGGRFFFLVQPGLYRLTVTKLGFQFPSQHLAEKKEDVQYIDLYHGELMRVTDKDAVITPNIPLDPSQAAKYSEPKNIRWNAHLRMIQHIIALSGVIVSIVFAIIRPNVLAAVMVLIQIGVYQIVQRLAKPRKPKTWGIVYDKNTGRPLSNVVARIFEPKYNKLLETQVTDSKGRYSFLLGPAEYYAVFEKEGYRSTQIKPIDFTKDTEAKDFSKDINLLLKEA
jgi:hypothetical protein